MKAGPAEREFYTQYHDNYQQMDTEYMHKYTNMYNAQQMFLSL